jgi:endonuclease G
VTHSPIESVSRNPTRSPRKKASRSSKSKKTRFRALWWTLLATTLIIGTSLSSCSEPVAKTGHELAQFVQSVLTSPKLKAKLEDVLGNLTTASVDDLPAQLEEFLGNLTTASVDDLPAQLEEFLGNLTTASADDLPAQREGAKAKAGTEQFSQCPQFFAHGQSPILPAPQSTKRPLCYEAFAILHNGQTRTPVFVAERLDRASVADADEKRTDKFFGDARLPSRERAELSDYRNSGYSRGHMAPAGNMPNPTAMAQSFSLANMIPQLQRHNGGPWSKVERDTRKYASRAKGAVYVITGPIYSAGSRIETIGENKVRVPDHIFKLVYDEAGNRARAHWHANSDTERGGPPISYQELVKRTGIDFLPGAEL